MAIVISRFGLKDDFIPLAEVQTWALADENDPRSQLINGEWRILQGVSSPLYDTTGLVSDADVQSIGINLDTGEERFVNVEGTGGQIINPDFFNPTNLPLAPGVVETDRATYDANVANYIANNGIKPPDDD